jgi:hypothetical protein
MFGRTKSSNTDQVQYDQPTSTGVPASEPPARDAVTDRRTIVTDAHPWSPLQIVGLVIGIGYVVLGIAALVRTGFDTSNIYRPHDVVWKLPHSPLLAVIEIGFGVLVILGSVVPPGLRSLLGLLGAGALAFGIVVVIETVPNRLNDWLAVTHRSGWLFVISGGVLLVAAIVSPVFYMGGERRRDRTVIRDHVMT